MTLHFLNGVANDAEWKQKINHYAIFTILRVNQLGKLINRIPGFLLPEMRFQSNLNVI